MGQVFEAFDRERQVSVALKTLTTRDPESLIRFKREFRSIQSVHHPNLVSLGELFEHEGVWFFTMELVQGVDLVKHVRGEHGFDVARLRAAFHQLALGLTALHREGHIHRDMKPSNVLITPENRVVILDFGLIRDAEERSAESSANVVLGTPEYMAPEQAAGYEISQASDWYAVGALLYEALVGEPPFIGKPVEIMVNKQLGDPLSPALRVSNVPGDLDSLCMALLRREALKRPGEADILKRLYVELRKDDRTFLTLPLQPGGERFVGREADLDTLERAWTQARSGVHLLFVTGAWGIGKTALVREFARRRAADSHPPIIWSGRCHERETIPFKAVDMLIDDASRLLAKQPTEKLAALLPPNVDFLARTFPVLERVEAIARLPLRSLQTIEAPQRRSLLVGAFRELFRRIARVRPMILLVEDLQWADLDGLGMLRDLLAPPTDAPILFVGTMRTDDQALVSAPSALVDGLDASTISTLHVGPLSDTDAEELVRTYWPSADARDAHRVATHAGGHPLFTREMCLSRRPGKLDLGGALRTRIAALPPEVRKLLDLIAVSASALTQEVVGAAAGLPRPEVERGLSLLRAAQLVRTVGLRRTDLVEIAHDRVREAVLDTVLPPTLKLLHRQIAETLAFAPPSSARVPVEALAEHWLGAGEPQRACGALIAGGVVAADAHAYERAAALFRRALPHCEPDQRVSLEARIEEISRLASR
jgi:hypothetical protein